MTKKTEMIVMKRLPKNSENESDDKGNEDEKDAKKNPEKDPKKDPESWKCLQMVLKKGSCSK